MSLEAAVMVAKTTVLVEQVQEGTIPGDKGVWMVQIILEVMVVMLVRRK